MTLPIDRSTLALAQGNQVPYQVAASAKNINFLKVVADTIDELNVKVDAHASSVLLPHTDASVSTAKMADLAVTTPKIANLAVTGAKVANATLDASKFIAGVLNNETANGLLIAALSADVLQRGINVCSAPYNADPTGVTDCYAAIKAAVAAINTAGGGMLVFPPGTYFINQYKTALNSITDIEFTNCNGLFVIGYGATVSVKGNINRTVTSDATVIPFKFTNCQNFNIEGFKLNGNVDLMTRTALLTEGSSYGVQFASCVNFAMSNMYIHHFATDGVYISDDAIQTNPRIACKQGTLTNVKSEYNARQGISIIQLRGAEFINCEFNWTGRASGSYGVHSPSAGWDIEPNRNTATASPNQMDVNTGDLEFINCKCTENAGAQALASKYGYIDGVSYIGSRFVVGGGGTGGSDQFILDTPRALVIGCYFEIGAAGGRMYFGYVTNNLSDITVMNSTFKSPNAGKMISSQVNVRLKIDNCDFIHTGTTPIAGSPYYVDLVNTFASFTNNYVYIPKEVYTDGGTGDRQPVLQLNIKKARNNEYKTDLLAASGDTGTAHYSVTYGTSTVISDETFIGTAQGTADTFRPVFNGAFDTRTPYSKSGSKLQGSATYDPASLIDGAGATTTLTVSGAQLGDYAVASFSRDLQGIMLTAWVSAADTVSVRFQNETTGTIDLASGTLRAVVTKTT